ncbi:hypothetical protein FQN54_005496 [Arachnomyces sp. PD_36]|nr:hypothetical protein FQN54_005496 [Arachnomyces sp. PD_36]
MSSTKTATMTARSSPLSGRSNKSPTKPTKSIILKLPPSLLGRFPGLPTSDSQSETKVKLASASPDDSSTSQPAPATADTTAATSTAPAPTAPTPSGDNASDAASTPAPAPAPGATTPSGLSDSSKKKGVPGPKPGNKRPLGQGVETTPRPRGKPGPKKKARLDDTPEGQVRTSTGGGSHRLGPKANQGTINANLRALDRTGKPCRKWERKPFQLKSFTGVAWGVPTWRAPKSKAIEEISAEATGEATPNGDAGSKANNSASAVESEKSNSGDGDATPMNTNAASSPAPAAAVAA